MLGYSAYTGYAGYTPMDWIPVQLFAKGKRVPISGSATTFRVEADASWSGAVVKFPTDPTKASWTMVNLDPATWNYSCVLLNSEKVTIDMPGKTPGQVSYTGPWFSSSYQTLYHRYLQVVNGTMKIDKIYYSSGN
jgi:hypothetical protein